MYIVNDEHGLKIVSWLRPFRPVPNLQVELLLHPPLDLGVVAHHVEHSPGQVGGGIRTT